MEIKRDRYLNLLISKKHNGLIKVITGMRRCGKSYLLFTLFKDYLLSEGIEKNHIIEIAFDAYENKQYRETVSRTLISLLGDEGRKAVENAVNEYIEIFGKEFLC